MTKKAAGRMVPEPRRVFALQYGHLNDTRAGVVFEERLVQHPTEKAKDGTSTKCYMGVAEEVPEDVVARWYYGHPSFMLSGYDEAELAEIRLQLDGPMHGAMGAGVPVPAKQDKAELDEKKPAGQQGAPEGDQGGAGDQKDGDDTKDTDDDKAATVTTVPGVNFASDEAGEAAVSLGLTVEDFKSQTPSGREGGYTTGDVRKVKAAKDQLAGQ